MSDDIERELLEAIQKNPEDEDARAVYADWLDDRGDVRGEYIRLEAQLYRIPARLTELSQVIGASWLDSISRLYDVTLGNPGVNKIMVIKAIRTVTGLGLKDSKDITDTVSCRSPYMLRQRLDRNAALALVAQFDGSGATVSIVPHYARATATLDQSDVVLVSIVAEQRIAAIKAVRELTELPLKEARDLVDRVVAGTPCMIVRAVDPTRAAEIAAMFAGCGEVTYRRGV